MPEEMRGCALLFARNWGLSSGEKVSVNGNVQTDSKWRCHFDIFKSKHPPGLAVRWKAK